MIKPDKHTNIKLSVPYLSAVSLGEIQRNGVIRYDDLKNVLIQKVGAGASENFQYALSFLYLMGKIEYVEKLDSIKTIEL
jgi:Cys-tRNA synthase (O-phospho-L-seryl-tRNA:Cys-tRNA synthase)